MNSKLYKNKNFYIFLILIFAAIIRLYNINYDDFWSDEMVVYWISDPHISLKETIERLFSSNLLVTFEIVLKYFHLIFGYKIDISRYFPFIISLLSLFAFYKLSRRHSGNKSSIIALLLLCTNIYHIKYSIELRSYILSFLLSIIFIYLIFKNNFEEKKINKNISINYFIIGLISFLMLFSHPFTIIIIISFIFFKLIEIYKNEKFKIYDFRIIFYFLIIILFFLVFYLLNINHTPYWIEQVKPSFYTNFFFSTFFGSRILGSIYLLSLIFIMIKFKDKIFKELNIFTFSIILIFFSYCLPLIFGYLFKPILIDRYIFFVLIPVIFVISHFIMLFKSNIFKYLMIFLLLIVPLLNHLLFENTLRQFYTSIYPTKPEVKRALKIIENSEYKYFSFKMKKDNFLKINDIYENYLLKSLERVDLEINYLNYLNNKNLPNEIWLIYFTDITDEKFTIDSNLNEFEIIDKKKVNRLELYLLKKN